MEFVSSYEIVRIASENGCKDLSATSVKQICKRYNSFSGSKTFQYSDAETAKLERTERGQFCSDYGTRRRGWGLQWI